MSEMLCDAVREPVARGLVKAVRLECGKVPVVIIAAGLGIGRVVMPGH